MRGRLLILMALLPGTVVGLEATRRGQTMEELWQEKGEPSGVMTCGNRTVLQYPECTVHVRDGLVVEILRVRDHPRPPATRPAQAGKAAPLAPSTPIHPPFSASPAAIADSLAQAKGTGGVRPSANGLRREKIRCFRPATDPVEAWRDATPMPAAESQDLVPTFPFPESRHPEIKRPGPIARPPPVRYPANRQQRP